MEILHMRKPDKYGDSLEVESLDGFSFALKMSNMFKEISKLALEFCPINPQDNSVGSLLSKIESLEQDWHRFGSKFDRLQEKNDQLSATLVQEKKKSYEYLSKLLKIENEKKSKKSAETQIYCLKPKDKIAVAPGDIQSCMDTLASIKSLAHSRENKAEISRKQIVALSIDITNLKDKNIALVKCLKEFAGTDCLNFDLEKYLWRETSESLVKVQKARRERPKRGILPKHSSSTTISEHWSNFSARCENEFKTLLRKSSLCAFGTQILGELPNEKPFQKHIHDFKSLKAHVQQINKRKRQQKQIEKQSTTLPDNPQTSNVVTY